MRKITSHELNDCNNQIELKAMDEPGPGGANHYYQASYKDRIHARRHTDIIFQNGPIPDNGVNGITQEVLLAIVIDRLECFQKGMFPNDYNAAALAHCKDALSYLHDRTIVKGHDAGAPA